MNTNIENVIKDFNMRDEIDFGNWIVYETNGAHKSTWVSLSVSTDTPKVVIALFNEDEDATPQTNYVELAYYDDKIVRAVLTQWTFTGQEGG